MYKEVGTNNKQDNRAIQYTSEVVYETALKYIKSVLSSEFELGLVYISPKNWQSPSESLISAISQKVHIFAQYIP